MKLSFVFPLLIRDSIIILDQKEESTSFDSGGKTIQAFLSPKSLFRFLVALEPEPHMSGGKPFYVEVVINLTAEEEKGYKMALDKKVGELGLSVRSTKCLSVSYQYLGELVQATEQELMGIRNFGPKSLKEVKNDLAALGLILGMKLKGWVRPSETQGNHY